MFQPHKGSRKISAKHLQASKVKLNILKVLEPLFLAKIVAEDKAQYLVVGIVAACNKQRSSGIWLHSASNLSVQLAVLLCHTAPQHQIQEV